MSERRVGNGGKAKHEGEGRTSEGGLIEAELGG